jgi:hypothetical protein
VHVDCLGPAERDHCIHGDYRVETFNESYPTPPFAAD